MESNNEKVAHLCQYVGGFSNLNFNNLANDPMEWKGNGRDEQNWYDFSYSRGYDDQQLQRGLGKLDGELAILHK